MAPDSRKVPYLSGAFRKVQSRMVRNGKSLLIPLSARMVNDSPHAGGASQGFRSKDVMNTKGRQRKDQKPFC
jgi:hypothetical protein